MKTEVNWEAFRMRARLKWPWITDDELDFFVAITQEQIAMDWDGIKANWKRVRDLAKAKWPWMTDADLDAMAGDRTKMDARIAAEHGITVQEAKHQTQEFGLKVEAAPGDVVAKAAKQVALEGASKQEAREGLSRQQGPLADRPDQPRTNPGTGHS